MFDIWVSEFEIRGWGLKICSGVGLGAEACLVLRRLKRGGGDLKVEVDGEAVDAREGSARVVAHWHEVALVAGVT